eukprot:11833999-Alexandrium_andersonii.AAC.1
MATSAEAVSGHPRHAGQAVDSRVLGVESTEVGRPYTCGAEHQKRLAEHRSTRSFEVPGPLEAGVGSSDVLVGLRCSG